MLQELYILYSYDFTSLTLELAEHETTKHKEQKSPVVKV